MCKIDAAAIQGSSWWTTKSKLADKNQTFWLCLIKDEMEETVTEDIRSPPKLHTKSSS